MNEKQKNILIALAILAGLLAFIFTAWYIRGRTTTSSPGKSTAPAEIKGPTLSPKLSPAYLATAAGTVKNVPKK